MAGKRQRQPTLREVMRKRTKEQTAAKRQVHKSPAKRPPITTVVDSDSSSGSEFVQRGRTMPSQCSTPVTIADDSDVYDSDDDYIVAEGPNESVVYPVTLEQFKKHTNCEERALEIMNELWHTNPALMEQESELHENLQEHFVQSIYERFYTYPLKCRDKLNLRTSRGVGKLKKKVLSRATIKVHEFKTVPKRVGPLEPQNKQKPTSKQAMLESDQQEFEPSCSSQVRQTHLQSKSTVSGHVPKNKQPHRIEETKNVNRSHDAITSRSCASDSDSEATTVIYRPPALKTLVDNTENESEDFIVPTAFNETLVFPVSYQQFIDHTNCRQQAVDLIEREQHKSKKMFKKQPEMYEQMLQHSMRQMYEKFYTHPLSLREKLGIKWLQCPAELREKILKRASVKRSESAVNVKEYAALLPLKRKRLSSSFKQARNNHAQSSTESDDEGLVRPARRRRRKLYTSFTRNDFNVSAIDDVLLTQQLHDLVSADTEEFIPRLAGNQENSERDEEFVLGVESDSDVNGNSQKAVGNEKENVNEISVNKPESVNNTSIIETSMQETAAVNLSHEKNQTAQVQCSEQIEAQANMSQQNSENERSEPIDVPSNLSNVINQISDAECLEHTTAVNLSHEKNPTKHSPANRSHEYNVDLLQFLRRPKLEVATIKFPVPLATFKNATHCNEIVDTILEALYQDKDDDSLRDRVLSNYYMQYYTNPQIREKYELKLKPCPMSLRRKIESIPQAEARPEANENVSSATETTSSPMSDNPQSSSTPSNTSTTHCSSSPVQSPPNTDKQQMQQSSLIAENPTSESPKPVDEGGNLKGDPAAEGNGSFTVNESSVSTNKIYLHPSAIDEKFLLAYIQAKTNNSTKCAAILELIKPCFPHLHLKEKPQILSVVQIKPAEPAPVETTEAKLERVKEFLNNIEYEKTQTFAYLLRYHHGVKRRILDAVTSMNIDEFSRYTHLYDEPHAFDDPTVLRYCYNRVFEEHKVWPIALFMPLAKLHAYLQSKKVPYERLKLEHVSPELLHWSDLMELTDFDDCVRLDYRKCTGTELQCEDLLGVWREDFYSRCWMRDEWLWKTPVLKVQFQNKFVGVKEDVQLKGDASKKSTTKETDKPVLDKSKGGENLEESKGDKSNKDGGKQCAENEIVGSIAKANRPGSKSGKNVAFINVETPVSEANTIVEKQQKQPVKSKPEVNPIKISKTLDSLGIKVLAKNIENKSTKVDAGSLKSAPLKAELIAQQLNTKMLEKNSTKELNDHDLENSKAAPPVSQSQADTNEQQTRSNEADKIAKQGPIEHPPKSSKASTVFALPKTHHQTESTGQQTLSKKVEEKPAKAATENRPKDEENAEKVSTKQKSQSALPKSKKTTHKPLDIKTYYYILKKNGLERFIVAKEKTSTEQQEKISEKASTENPLAGTETSSQVVKSTGKKIFELKSFQRGKSLIQKTSVNEAIKESKTYTNAPVPASRKPLESKEPQTHSSITDKGTAQVFIEPQLVASAVKTAGPKVMYESQEPQLYNVKGSSSISSSTNVTIRRCRNFPMVIIPNTQAQIEALPNEQSTQDPFTDMERDVLAMNESNVSLPRPTPMKTDQNTTIKENLVAEVKKEFVPIDGLEFCLLNDNEHFVCSRLPDNEIIIPDSQSQSLNWQEMSALELVTSPNDYAETNDETLFTIAGNSQGIAEAQRLPSMMETFPQSTVVFTQQILPEEMLPFVCAKEINVIEATPEDEAMIIPQAQQQEEQNFGEEIIVQDEIIQLDETEVMEQDLEDQSEENLNKLQHPEQNSGVGVMQQEENLTRTQQTELQTPADPATIQEANTQTEQNFVAMQQEEENLAKNQQQEQQSIMIVEMREQLGKTQQQERQKEDQPQDQQTGGLMAMQEQLRIQNEENFRENQQQEQQNSEQNVDTIVQQLLVENRNVPSALNEKQKLNNTYEPIEQPQGERVHAQKLKTNVERLLERMKPKQRNKIIGATNQRKPKSKTSTDDVVPQATHAFRALPVAASKPPGKRTDAEAAPTPSTQPVVSVTPLVLTPTPPAAAPASGTISQSLSTDCTLFNNTSLIRLVEYQQITEQPPMPEHLTLHENPHFEVLPSVEPERVANAEIIQFETVTVDEPVPEATMLQQPQVNNNNTKPILYRRLDAFTYFDNLSLAHIEANQLRSSGIGQQYAFAKLKCDRQPTLLHGEVLGTLFGGCCKPSLLRDVQRVLSELKEFHYKRHGAFKRGDDVRANVLQLFMRSMPIFTYAQRELEDYAWSRGHSVDVRNDETVIRKPHCADLSKALKATTLARIAELKAKLRKH